MIIYNVMFYFWTLKYHLTAAGITYLPRKGTPVSHDFTRAKKCRATLCVEYGKVTPGNFCVLYNNETSSDCQNCIMGPSSFPAHYVLCMACELF